ncbi:MAG TPA: CmcI family methyltransferase [Chitinophagales bacterium]|nr:CmcI family methyltransferase [Chitinophagales bacterium]
MIKIDTAKGVLIIEEGSIERTVDLGSADGFRIVSDIWLRSGWDAKYVYSFSWLGRPIIQLPDDLLRIQEVIFNVKPDVIIETGVAHGGSLIFYATLCKAMDHGRVIGIDIEIRPHNRKAIEEHFLFPFITLIEGSSVDEKIVSSVQQQVKPDEKVLVLLDSNHTKQHVLDELNVYSPLVTLNSYIVATDGIMEKLEGAPRSAADWNWNNPKKAAEEFARENKNFIIEEPAFLFNEGIITERVTYWPSAFIKRIG